jgi:hypothetical protein
MQYGKTVLWAASLGLAAIVTQPAASAPAKSAATAMRSTDFSAQQQRRRPPTRITVAPLSRYYRQCDSWLAVEHRPSGDVITPQMRCRWALR